MNEQSSAGFHPLFVTMLMLMSSRPDLEGKIANLAAMLEATQKTLNTLRTGIENFHAMMLQLSAVPETSSGTFLPDKQPPAYPADTDEVTFPTITLPDTPKNKA